MSGRYGDYDLGLDLGSGSVGWAAVGKEHELLNVNGHPALGVNLFDEGRSEKERSLHRRMRRRYFRRHIRFESLRSLFSKEIEGTDPFFFSRMDESMLKGDDLSTGSLGACLRELDLYDRFPTVYHLRQHLMRTDEKPDIRLLYLAVHHLVKKSGHFLFSGTAEGAVNLKDAVQELEDRALMMGCPFGIGDAECVSRVLSDGSLSVSAMAHALCPASGTERDGAVASLLSGGKASLKSMFPECESDLKLSLNGCNEQELEDMLAPVLDEEDLQLMRLIKGTYDIASITKDLHGFGTVSEMKVHDYELHHRDLMETKDVVKRYAPEHYREIFRGDSCIYASYSCRRDGKGSCRRTQTEVCRHIHGLLSGTGAEDDPVFSRIMCRLDDGSAFPKQKVPDNVLIPNALQQKELRMILNNMERFFPFLSEKDGSGITVSDKVLMVQSFRIPYYIGPLDDRSKHSWVIRKNHEHTHPWNLEDNVDVEATAERFMIGRVGQCRRMPWEKALPRNSLIYSRFLYYNIVNQIRIDGRTLSAEMKEELLHCVFEKTDRNVSMSDIRMYLRTKKEYSDRDPYVSGMHETVRNPTRSMQVMRRMLGKAAKDEHLCERIIQICTVFSDSTMIRRMLERECGDILTEGQIDALSDVRFYGWGLYSERFLSHLYVTADDSGRMMNLLGIMECTGLLMNEVLDTFPFDAVISRFPEYRNIQDVDRYVRECVRSPRARRTVCRMMSVVKDVVRHIGYPPSRIFIEQTGTKGKDPGTSRRSELLRLYKKNSEDPIWVSSLDVRSDAELRNRRLYLYYSQLGRCMYCGCRLNVREDWTVTGADLDHIHPRSSVRDDCMSDNLVLTCRSCNEKKGARYPLDGSVQERMRPMWVSLHRKRYISDTKFLRLTGSDTLPRVSFSSAQVSETSVAVKHAEKVLNMFYGSTSKVILVNGEVSSELRQTNGLVKCRSVNDLHHAFDAYLCILAGDCNGSVRRLTDAERSVFRCRDVRYTRNPHTEHGQLFRDNLYSAGDGTVSRKKGMDIGTYGGYRNTTKAFFSLVRYRLLKHMVNAIEPVELCSGIRPDDKDGIRKYLSETTGREVEVLIPCIKCDSLLDWGGMRVTLRGLSKNRMNIIPAVQLVLSDEDMAYCKRLYNYEMATRGGAQVSIDRYSFSAERNTDLYDRITALLDSEPYRQVMSAVAGNLRKCRDRFEVSDLCVQARVLNQVLRLTQCNPSRADLREVGGIATCGNLMIKSRLPPADRTPVFLIHQSPSGLSETRVQLN